MNENINFRNFLPRESGYRATVVTGVYAWLSVRTAAPPKTNTLFQSLSEVPTPSPRDTLASASKQAYRLLGVGKSAWFNLYRASSPERKF
ncbi:hypothetical protein BaRGS_00014256 [Batillaria attramentaria]|uniref:Uncharacterized protein n=1 Tax=Batillaria attramentaria TaxID=370345 RepID=A0ABD0L4X9_9CAEN